MDTLVVFATADDNGDLHIELPKGTPGRTYRLAIRVHLASNGNPNDARDAEGHPIPYEDQSVAEWLDVAEREGIHAAARGDGDQRKEDIYQYLEHKMARWEVASIVRELGIEELDLPRPSSMQRALEVMRRLPIHVQVPGDVDYREILERELGNPESDDHAR